MTETTETKMTDLESMQYHCDTWNTTYLHDKPSQDVLLGALPFDLIKQHGRLFTHNDSAELKSDEEQLIKKAIKRLGAYNDEAYSLRLGVPVKTFYHENSDKIKLYHGLVKYSFVMGTHELSWITINDKVIDLHTYNCTNNKGNINKGTLYYGIEIPRTVLKETAMTVGLGLEIKHPKVIALEMMPNHTTILIKSHNRLKEYYENK